MKSRLRRSFQHQEDLMLNRIDSKRAVLAALNAPVRDQKSLTASKIAQAIVLGSGCMRIRKPISHREDATLGDLTICQRGEAVLADLIGSLSPLASQRR